MELTIRGETDDVIPGNEEKSLQVWVYITSNFVTTNDEDFKILIDMANLYL
jgi:hypothetical protein